MRNSSRPARAEGGKTGPLDHQEPVSGNAERGVMMESSPAAAFIMPQAQFLLQFLVVSLYDPTMFGQPHQGGQSGLSRESGPPPTSIWCVRFLPSAIRSTAILGNAVGYASHPGARAECEPRQNAISVCVGFLPAR